MPLWDVFCRVIDNWGDMGVCWRLARHLAGRRQRVRLWCDDHRALAWMAPGGCQGVRVLDWPHGEAADFVPGDVVIEAFGCELPQDVVAAMARQLQDGGHQRTLWLNLEYLSAQDWAARSHGLPSPVGCGAGAGLCKYFFYPGFAKGTGGLLREPDLLQRQAGFSRAGWLAAHGLSPEQASACVLDVSMFCYEPPAMLELVQQWSRQAQWPVRLWVTPGRAADAVRAAVQAGGMAVSSPALTLHFCGYVPQDGFDEMLQACELNFVRGEDSLVRALWAGNAFVWHIYPQHDDAHHAKLEAFLDWLQAPPSLRAFHRIWNGMEPGPIPAPDRQTLAQWWQATRAARQRLLAQPDLVSQLLDFVAEKRK